MHEIPVGAATGSLRCRVLEQDAAHLFDGLGVRLRRVPGAHHQLGGDAFDVRTLVLHHTVGAFLRRAVALQIGKVMSEVLVLGFPDDDGEVILIVPDQLVPNGNRLY